LARHTQIASWGINRSKAIFETTTLKFQTNHPVIHHSEVIPLEIVDDAPEAYAAVELCIVAFATLIVILDD
jgi:hypothetical protein